MRTSRQYDNILLCFVLFCFLFISALLRPQSYLIFEANEMASVHWSIGVNCVSKYFASHYILFVAIRCKIFPLNMYTSYFAFAFVNSPLDRMRIQYLIRMMKKCSVFHMIILRGAREIRLIKIFQIEIKFECDGEFHLFLFYFI